ARKEAPDFGIVAFQFGLGLLATGYAVLARIHLTTGGPQEIDEQNAHDVVNRYLERTRDLINNVESAASSFEVFGERVRLETEKSTSASIEAARTAVRDAVNVFGNEMRSATGSATEGIREVRSFLENVGFENERKELKQAL